MYRIALALALFFCQEIVQGEIKRTRRSLTDFIKHYEPLSYDQDLLLRKHHRARRSIGGDSTLEFSFHAHDRDFHMRLQRDDKRFSANFRPEGEEFHPENIYQGELANDPGSKVHGFIHDKIFEGRIITSQNEDFFIESAKQYLNDAKFHSVIYNGNDVDYPYPHGSSCGVKKETRDWMESVQKDVKTPKPAPIKFTPSKDNMHTRQRRAVTAPLGDKISCQLYLQADYTFTEAFAGSKDRAMYLMTQYVQAAGHIYQQTDFNQDGAPEGIQFVIARMTANKTSDCTGSCPFSEANLGVEIFLGYNSDMDHSDFCLAYIFTHRDFADGVLGLAWIAETGSAAGGICEKYRPFGSGKSRSLNTGIVTTLNYQKTVPGKVIYITLAHELGHNFGSKHDPETVECAPASTGRSGGNYIMYKSATSGSLTNNDQFSKCSKGYIWPVLEAKSGICFQKPSGPICGNKVVEGNEQCDCGYKNECDDPCCVPKETGKDVGCTYSQLAKNVPTDKRCSHTQGPCCNRTTCTIRLENSSQCSGATECALEAYCNGTSALCPKPAPKPDETLCSGGTKVCLSGGCTGSICLKHQKQECFCTQSDHLCDICCKNGTDPNSKCSTLKIKKAPGSPCDNYKGYCDILYACRKVDAEGPLSRLKKFFLSKEALNNIIAWMKEYWWACVLIGLGIVLLMAGFIKVCSVHTPSSNPNMKAARPMTLPRSLSRRHRPTAPPPMQMNHPPAYDEEPLPGYNTAIREPAPSQQAHRSRAVQPRGANGRGYNNY